MALTVQQVKDITTDFCREYPGARALKFQIRNTQEDLYGHQASHIPTLCAAYHPHRGVVAIPAANLRDDYQLRRTLRHEIIGHFGLNTFDADEKRKILEAILRSRAEGSMRRLWQDVERAYPKASPLLKAEELFAFLSERMRPSQAYELDPGLRVLNTVLSDPKSIITQHGLQTLTALIAQGLADGTRLQRNFPQSDDALFSAEKIMSKPRVIGATLESREMGAVDSYHEKVAAKLIEQLKQGTAPWQRPILPGSANSAFPYNPTTGANYRGMNMITLMAAQREDSRWMTYRQAEAQGAQVRQGERATPIQFWSFTKTRDLLEAQGKPVLDARGQKLQETVNLARPMVRFASVFNAEQIDGLRETRAPQVEPTNTISRANELLAATGADIRHDQVDKMFYRVGTDTIHLPDPAQFRSAGDYYATAFHEVGHWTGHPDRLNRDLAHPFGSQGYAKEELRAEIASLMISQELNLPHNPANHASYVGSWIEVLQNDPREIFRAASDAEKIRGLVMGMNRQQEQNVEQDAAAKSLSSESVPLDRQATPAPDRHFIDVPFAEKEEAKALGARWDRGAKSWYVPADLAASAFARWPLRGSSTTGRPEAATANEQRVSEAAQAASTRVSDSTLHQINDSTRLVRAMAPLADDSLQNVSLSQQLAQADIRAFQHLPAGSTEHHSALALIGESAALDAHYAATLRVLDAAVAGAAQDAFQTKPDPIAPASLEAADPDKSQQRPRAYLLVPYAEREQARAAGARWDAHAKSWYVGANADHEKLAKWELAASRAVDTSANPREEFAARLQEAGARVTGEHPIMDGGTHRIAVVEDKPYERSGFYVGHLDDIRPAGYFKNNRSGEEFRWKAKGYILTAEHKAAFVASAAAKLEERERTQQARQEQRADQLAQGLATLRPVSSETRTPYLVAKRVSASTGVFTDSAGDTLFVPLMDAKGRQWSQQYIRGDGTKRLASEARKEGCFHVIDGFDRLKEAKVFVLAEGYATAATIHESHGAKVAVAVVAAVDAGNLTAVAKALRTEFPATPILIAGDDDRPLQQRENKNPGRSGALAAAAAVDGLAVFPIFDTQDATTLTDFNDLVVSSSFGLDGLRRQLTPLIEKAAGLEERAQGEKLATSRTRAVRRRGPKAEDAGPRRIKRSIA